VVGDGIHVLDEIMAPGGTSEQFSRDQSSRLRRKAAATVCRSPACYPPDGTFGRPSALLIGG